MASELRATNVCTNHEIVFVNGECDLCKLLAELASRDELLAKAWEEGRQEGLNVHWGWPAKSNPYAKSALLAASATPAPKEPSDA